MVSRQTRRMPAPCRLDPEGWFPDGTVGTAARSEMKHAAGLCRTLCSIQEECLKVAMAAEGDADAKNRFGVFGGLTPGQRADLSRQRRAAQQGLAA
ncbi:WhiB family transcriptional regulator [Kitasatospora cineracea]